MQEVEKEIASPSASRPNRPATNVTVFIGVAAAMLVAFVAFSRQVTPPDVPVRKFASTVPQQPDPIAEPIEAPVAEVPPVRFKNPFDKTEVFEFPAGTTRAEARDAVAEILRNRALERQALDTRPTHRR